MCIILEEPNEYPIPGSQDRTLVRLCLCARGAWLEPTPNVTVVLYVPTRLTRF